MHEERSLYLEMVERGGVRMVMPRGGDVGEPALDQAGDVLRLAAQLLAHADGFEQRVGLVGARTYQSRDDALVPGRLAVRLRGLRLLPRRRRRSCDFILHGACPFLRSRRPL
jgi:hypothetical protein